MHLLDNYSSVSRLRIDEPFLIDSFYPLPFEDPYAVITNSTGMPGKNYKYWNDVLRFTKRIGLKVVQVGLRDDPALDVDFHLMGMTNINQLFGLVKNSILVLCGDTSLVHIASVYKTPMVSVFGLTDPLISGPYKKWKTDEQICLEPDRSKFRPTFDPNDGSVNNIYPDKICQAIAKIFSVDEPIDRVHYVGPRYGDKIVEMVPDHLLDPRAFGGAPVILRNDYLENSKIIFQNLSNRKCSVVTKSELDISGLVQLRENILGISYEVGLDTEPDYLKTIMRFGIPLSLFAEKKNISEIRFKLLDLGIHVFEKPVYEPRKELLDFSIRSDKILLSDGEIYLNKTAWLSGDAAKGGQRIGKVYDTQDFWNEQDHFMFIEL